MAGYRKIISALLTAVAILTMSSCQKAELPEPEPQLAVNFTNTSGEWELKTWNGNDMSDTPMHLTLKAKKFTIVQTIGSMYPETFTGSYNIYEEEGLGMIIRGIYDYTYEYWANRYIISSLTASSMEWTTVGKDEILTFKKVIETY
ncbi:MAG: hypothetical protein KBS67_02755 [Bacteroidales bacterium]|nr:hypothetical protein [Candidatus Cryptobacteroides equifaecalis]